MLGSEEDTFWTLAMIVEVYLPPDYFVEMKGARRLMLILKRIIKDKRILSA